jgi:protein-L-isoaspartate(D-aspartate) O-methyltransferase
VSNVPREAYLDFDLSAESAYANEPVLLKRDERGRAVSTISQPTMVVTMLEQLRAQPGDRVLEIGTASGWNAALIAHLVGPRGEVVTVELEPDLAAGAARSLKNQGVVNVSVLCADGRQGWAPGAPYDGIVVTAGADKVEESWANQLREGGRLVVPVAPGGGMGTCFAFEKRDGRLHELERTPCGFVPLRSHPVGS